MNEVKALRNGGPVTPAPPDPYGGRPDSWIENQLGVQLDGEYKQKFSDVWQAVQKGGDGTIAVATFGSPRIPNTHTVTVVNMNGRVYLLEAQQAAGHPPEILDSLNAVHRRYGEVALSFAIVPRRSIE